MQISIITCTYNSESTIGKCIDSVFLQWFDDKEYEHIFVDANSTDNTIEIIKQKYYNKSNYTIMLAEPKWAYNAMNIGISHAIGSYLYLLNSDDAIYGKWLSLLLSSAIKYNSDFCFGNVRYVDEKNKLLHILAPKKILLFPLEKKLYKNILLLFHYCCPQSTVYKKNLHDELGAYNESYKFLSDREFSIKVASSRYRTNYIDIDVCNFLVHNWSLTSNKNNHEKIYEEVNSIVNKYFIYGLGNLRVWFVKLVRFFLWFFGK